METQQPVNLVVDSPLAPHPMQQNIGTVELERQTVPPRTNGNGNGHAIEPGHVKAEQQPAPEIPQAIETPEEAPPEPWVTVEQDGKIKLRLRKAVQAHGEIVKYLTFKEPTGGDIERIGNPVSMGGGNLNFDSAAMTGMMSHLAGVPPSSVRALHSKDWTNGAYAIWGFFVPDA